MKPNHHIFLLHAHMSSKLLTRTKVRHIPAVYRLDPTAPGGPFPSHFKPASPRPAAPAPNPPSSSDPSLPRRAAILTDSRAPTTLPRPASTSSAALRFQPGPRGSERGGSRGCRSFVEASPEQSPRERVPIRDRNPGRRDRKNKSPSSAAHTHRTTVAKPQRSCPRGTF